MSSPSSLPSRRYRRTLIRTGFAAAALGVPALLLTGGSAAQAAPSPSPLDRLVEVPAAAKALAQRKVDLPLRSAKGTVDVSVTLSQQPVGAVVAEDAVATGALPSKAVQQARTKAVKDQQATLTAKAKALGAKVTGRATRAGNVVTLRVDASKLDEVAAVPGVVSVKRVARYRTTASPAAVAGSLAEAAEYLKVSGLRAQGLDGSGIRVAVLDSGIDYTHRNLGGPGTPEAFDECHNGADGKASDRAPEGACAALFGPSAPKVKGGYDFVGETWDGDVDPLEDPDPNPIDLEGHGTHVADIIAGRSADGAHQGLAPGADLYAVKVCSAVATACSGVALLQGVDWALDPNGDGDISDAVDLMNLSLGSDYGQPEDDLTVAVNNAIRAGVVGVVSAGNGGDRPFIVGSPSTASRAISVAQTSLPQDKIFPIAVAGATGITEVPYSVLQEWSPTPTASLTAPLAAPVGRFGCTADDFLGFPKGAVALVSRGSCNVSLKAANASAAGASSVLIYNNVGGVPPSFSFGGGDVTVPTYTISLDDGTALASALAAGQAVVVTIDPAKAVLLPNTMVGTSSRGPRIVDAVTKPDIGAPGAWLSAEVATGDEETNFGGTSGAAPTVSGVAVLVLQKHPKATPATVKARLLNGADPGNTTLDPTATPSPTPISRVGAGEVRADSAVGLTSVLANTTQAGGNLGWGMPRLTKPWSKTTTLKLRNTSGASRTYSLATSFRDGADAASGAVTVSVPGSVTVPARSEKSVKVTVRVDPAKLDVWPFTFTAGETTEGSELNSPEFDGFVTATSGAETVHLGWHVLPRRAGDVSAPASAKVGAGTTLTLKNASPVEVGITDVYALTGTSPKQPKPAPGEPGSPGSNVVLVDLAAVGVIDSADADLVAFAVADHRRTRTPLYPKQFEVDVDVDRDGTPEYALVNLEVGGFGATGLSAVYVVDLATFDAVPYFTSLADFDSATHVLAAPLSALGLEEGDTFDFTVYGVDGYLTGLATDVIEGMTWTVGGGKYATPGGVVTGPSSSAGLPVAPTGSTAESTQTGLLLLHGNNKGKDFQVVTLR